MAEEPRVSVVIPAYNEVLCLGKLYGELRAVCDRLPYSFEFLFVDDGSTDGTVAEARLTEPRVTCVRLSRNFGHQAAVSAGWSSFGGADRI